MFQSIFENFRNELDEHHDRRERIIKVSRDITALSKKNIFALQRVRAINQPIPPKIAQENQARLETIDKLFTSIVCDVSGINSWRYQRQIGGAIQEFIEAISFDHYLRTQTLITHAEVTTRVPAGIMVTEEDYVMGLFDLTGEMMRFAVLQLSSGNAIATQEVQDPMPQAPSLSPTQAAIVVDLRAMRARFEALSVPRKYHMLRDLHKKVEVMQSSVEKVERAAYGILVRGSERPSGWTPDLSAPMEVETH
jgi:predicted translin family RNA/ssDNA-binding protein